MIPRLFATIVLYVFAATSLAAAQLDRPAGLEPAIGFWRTVFAETTSNQALIHDNRNLAVVYEVVDLPANASSRQRRRIADRVRKKYRTALGDIVARHRQGLTREQQRVLALWPADVSDAELRSAMQRIRFQQGLSDRFRAGLIRSGRWEAHISRSLADAGVPPELASLPHVESSYNPAARSHVGASGLWQFTRSTGRRFMQIDHVVDERRDPYVSSQAAAALLRYNYSILHSWPLAITAYNHGVAGMRRAVRETGTDDIEVIINEYNGRAFGFASRNFYVALLAANDVAEHADQYFGELDKDPAESLTVVTLDSFVPADQLEQAFGVSQDTLQRYNPALLPSVWSGLKYVPRGFELRLPAAGGSSGPAALLASIPAASRFDRQTPDLEHRVAPGDSLSLIAARYDTSVSALMAINNLASRNRIRIGQVINLPVRAGAAAIADGADSYTVRSGDTLGGIAVRAGVSQSQILALNAMHSADRIYAGQKLLLRPGTGAGAAPAATTVVAESAPPAEIAPPPMPVVQEGPGATGPAGDDLAVGDDDVTATIVEEGTQLAADTGSTAGQPAEDSAETTLLADPSDYLVADDGTIEIQAAETLGHYADWLEIRTQRLRDLNGYAFRRPVVIGQRLKLRFDKVGPDEFAARRTAYHRDLQEAFFTRYRIVDTSVHHMRRGESVFVLSLRQYKVPIWLLRQYNPDLDIDRLRPGAPVVFPQIEQDTDDSQAARMVRSGDS